jgi:hypothetical protein
VHPQKLSLGADPYPQIVSAGTIDGVDSGPLLVARQIAKRMWQGSDDPKVR